MSKSSGVFTQLLQSLVVVVFLLVGLFYTLQSGPAGANVLTGFFRKKVMPAMRKGVSKGLSHARGRLGENRYVRSMEEKALGWAGRRRGPLGRAGGWAEKKWKRRSRKDIETITKDLDMFEGERREIEARRHGEKGLEALATLKVKNKERLTDDDIDRYKRAVSRGTADSRALTNLRPDTAGEFIEGTDTERHLGIQERVERRNPAKFQQETQAESFRNIDVLIGMNQAQFDRLDTRGSVEQKRNAVETLLDRHHEVMDRLDELRNEELRHLQEAANYRSRGNNDAAIEEENIAERLRIRGQSAYEVLHQIRINW